MAKNFEVGFWANTRGITAYDGSSLGILEASRYLSKEAPFEPHKDLTVLGALAKRAIGQLVVYNKDKIVTEQLERQYGINGYAHSVPRLYVAEVLPEDQFLEHMNADPQGLWAKEAYCALNGISTQSRENGTRASDAVQVTEYETTLLPVVAEDTVHMLVSKQK